MGSVCTTNEEVANNDEYPMDKKDDTIRKKKKKKDKKGTDFMLSQGPMNSKSTERKH